MQAGNRLKPRRRTARNILAFYDSESDPYYLENDYRANAEGGDFLDGRGICVDVWQDQYHESEDYWIPGGWFAWFDGSADYVIASTHWMPLPKEPEK